MLDRYGKEYALHAQGIYYRDRFSPDLVTCNRKVWIPSIYDDEEQCPDRWKRAKVLADHAKNNEDWAKSEYAWEADAWSDIFRPMRDDHCLEV